MSPVTTAIEDGIGLILIDNPPINASSAAVRAGLVAALGALDADASVAGIVIACAGRTFIAGAEIREFGKPRVPPGLDAVCNAIEASAKPVIAAMHGTALGGGLEIALACHGRVAATDAAIGLPEVTLGLLPGAGGAARLARIAGASEALALVVTGRRIGAVAAKAKGIVDQVVPTGDLIQAARKAARTTEALPTRDRKPPAPFDRAVFDAEAAGLTAKLKRQDAPAACVQSVLRAMTLPFDEAVAADREDFLRLSAGSQSHALRYAFFAERQAAKLPDGAQPRPIGTVAVIGAGTMGGGIAMSFAAAAVPVTLIDRDEEAVAKGLKRIRATYATSVARGSISQSEADARIGHIRGATAVQAAADADLVVEAVFEDMALKQGLFGELDRITRHDAVLATNTSALDVDAIATVMARPERFVGLHFFAPANVMKLVEVVRTATTDPVTLATAVAISRRIGKVPVVSGNCDGFIGNRMVAKRGAEVDRALLQGATPEQVDDALKAIGFPMGPLAINDMSGLDIGYAIRKRRGTPFAVADAVVEQGWLGQKTGRGYYVYEAGSRTPLPNPDLPALIAGVAAEAGVAKRSFDQTDLVERMLFPLVNEGARILEEGIAARASDIDTVWLNGYGFPRFKGGPLFHADEVGLAYVVARLESMAAETGSASLEPVPLLRRLAEAGEKLSAWDAAVRRPDEQQGECA
ncbi:3-hydroxyacyl-CoA dehydrogenase NAD-binding domain-containing protein [Sphingomonas profundi]|uniref:3-hydroxyacyl-CoA dehydrogenase NAD-binding domain-containing protein n=1 Tax=Alterirhizorhabdus profundi TaxID=2681549 RepID=UPI0012E857E0|nr:3-hydroxyacyl-CoA dehydrogenase NAD-binding domain-containing protein [Sphingomonas profundi]